jgi:hypothetical protein
LYDNYNFQIAAPYPANQTVVTTQLSLFVCPSAPAYRTDTYTDPFTRKQYPYAAGDYAVADGVDGSWQVLGYADSDGTSNSLSGIMRGNVCRTIAEIRDGTSTTIIVSEDAGRPQSWKRGALIQNVRVSGAGWADYESEFYVDGDGYAPCHTNCSNNNEVYAFHPGGAHHAFADGSVRFVKQSTNSKVFCRLITYNRGEILSSDQY